MIKHLMIKIMNEGMLTMKKLFALMLALAMMLTVVCAFAEGDGGEGGGETGQTTTSTNSTPSITIIPTSDEAETQSDTTTYTWYRILDANIGTDPISTDASQNGGAVSYHTDSAEKADALERTGLFTFDAGDGLWYAKLVNPSTSGAQMAEGLAQISATDLSLFPSGTFAQNPEKGQAESGDLAPGYYYIVSTAGKEAVVQTLTAVTIEEKNAYPTITKEVDENDENAQIGDEITYTIKVKIPSTANDKIVLTDTMSAGLSYKSIDSVKMNGTDVAAGANTYSVIPADDNDGFTLTFTKTFVTSAAGEADSSTKETEIEITYTAVLDKDAQTENPETNQVILDYGDHYTTKPKTAEVKTYEFKFDKIDGNEEEKVLLPGAEFNFMLNGEPMDLIEVKPGEEYRIALPNEENRTKTITTTGKTIRIYGLDSDVHAYSLQETKAAAGGYNIMPEAVPVKAGANGFESKDIKNFKGQVLPSTGGSGTTIFYVIGGLLIIGAAVVLVARRKAQE